MSQRLKTHILYLLFVLQLGLIVIDLLFKYLLKITDFGLNPYFLLTPALILAIHAVWALGLTKATLFIIVSSGLGLLFEIMGLTHGVVFGGTYGYNLEQFQPAVFQVPVFVAVFWAVFIYGGYNMVNTFLMWVGKTPLGLLQGSILVVPLLSLFDALVVVAIDLYMDPLAVAAGAWTWFEGGPYFGVPVGNFIGWFIVAFLASLIIRLTDYFFPNESDMPEHLYLLPVFGYFLLWLAFTYSAFFYGFYTLILIGTIVLLPAPVINVLMFRIWQKKTSKLK